MPLWSPVPRSARKHLNAIMKACVNCKGDGDDCFDVRQEPGAQTRGQSSPQRAPRCPTTTSSASSSSPSRATKSIEFPTYDTDWDSEAYLTVSGQNSNNSVRVTDDFLRRLRTTDLGSQVRRTQTASRSQDRQARDLWEKVGYAAWACADPGIQYHTTINDWHTCPASGEIRRQTRARNTCSSTTRPATWPRSTCCSSASLGRRPSRSRTSSMRAAVDHGAGNLRHDGPVPVQADRRNCPMNTARWASALPISAAS